MIQVENIREAILAAKQDIARARAKAGGRLFVGLYQDGGLGDLMRQLAFAAAVRRAFPDAWIHVVCRDLGPDADGRPICVNIVAGNPAANAATFVPRMPFAVGVHAFYRDFDLFYEVGYCVRTYAWLDPALQHRNDLLLRPFERYAAEFPRSSRRLGETGMTQWQLLAATSGLAVCEADLSIRLGRLPDELRKRRYVCVHNMAGGTALAKCAPLATFGALTAELRKHRIRCVQVGAATDPPIPGAEDYRGLRINDTAAVICRAKMLIDVEGGLGYIARAVRTRRACLFGPTPPSIFRFTSDIVLSTESCPPCWHHGPRWSVNCRKQYPICLNIPTDGAEIAKVLLRYIREVKR